MFGAEEINREAAILNNLRDALIMSQMTEPKLI